MSALLRQRRNSQTAVESATAKTMPSRNALTNPRRRRRQQTLSPELLGERMVEHMISYVRRRPSGQSLLLYRYGGSLVSLVTYMWILHNSIPPAETSRALFIRQPATPHCSDSLCRHKTVVGRPSHPKGSGSFQMPQDLFDVDFGGLMLDSLASADQWGRTIREDDLDLLVRNRRELLDHMDWVAEEQHDHDEYYDHFDDLDPMRGCVRLRWSYNVEPTCNSLHESILFERLPTLREGQEFEIEYLDAGAFKSAHLFTPMEGSSTHDDIVVKELLYENDYSRANYQTFEAEALLMGRLQGASRINNIYGYCGASLLVERGYEMYNDMIQEEGLKRSGRITQEELDELQQEDVHPMNDVSVEQKLDMAIAIAESLAELHGFKEGPIVHNDISTYQWLRSREGRIILNDFNTALILERDANEESSWCSREISFDTGNFKSPEEYSGAVEVNTSSDMYTVGNMLFGLLTGLMPFYSIFDDAEIRELVMKGTVPYLDPRYQNRSLIEGRIYGIMMDCYKLKQEERLDIFAVLERLRQTKQDHLNEVTLDFGTNYTAT